MMRKIIGVAAALALTAATLAPSAADARDYRRGYDSHHRGQYSRNYRDHDDNGAAVAAGVVGLVLGLALGAAASAPPRADNNCYDNYQRCAPPPPPSGYYNQGYNQEGYYQQPSTSPEPYYDDGSAYAQDYGAPPQGGYDPYYAAPQQPACTRPERQWDRYANRYLMVDVPC